MTDSELKSSEIVVVTTYKFVHLPDFRELREKLVQICTQQSLKGTLLLSAEGMNGTVAGRQGNIDSFLSYLGQDFRFSDLRYKEAFVTEMPFYRMKVRLKKEIVTMGVAGTDPGRLTGLKVDYKQWNQLVSDPDVLIIDTRNEYEHKIGTFKNSISPQTKTFREFPGFVDKELDPDKHKKIAMFCTGGIRCEKATNYLMRQGFEEVYHLQGGILGYLEDVREANRKNNGKEDNLWQGDCFVFDGRVAVDKNLERGNYTQCFACRMPLSKEELKSADYEKGVSCPYCINAMTEKKYARVSERQRQVELAENRQQQHIGASQNQINLTDAD